MPMLVSGAARRTALCDRDSGPEQPAIAVALMRARDTRLRFAVCLQRGHAQPADTILSTARSSVTTREPAQALAVRDGRIAAIGDSADIRALAGAAHPRRRSRRPHRHSRA